ncbi:MAG: nicotinate-nucleotide adenylyltransferase [Defluviitaleaceae bacterium]|nr:nicotinate-nucleotide adenylyltransferase [Defluviitaleaceae bacterium]
MENTIKNIALFGGSFDPIHLGHLHLAEIVREEFDLSEIIFMPSGLPPHKKLSSAVSNEQRYEMAVLATRANPRFKVSRLELDRGGHTYTVDTLMALKNQMSMEINIYFIVGADSLIKMHTWKEPEKLFKLCRIIVISRPGISDERIETVRIGFVEKYGAKIHLLKKRTYPISSTEIRRLASKGSSIRYFVSEEVYEYIREYNLYPQTVDRELVKSYLRENLSERRVSHSIRCAELSVFLAEIHSADTEKAYLAGLLHDIAKETPPDKWSKYDDCKDEHLFLYPEAAHAFIGASLAQKVFEIKDLDILNAIRYHTTARPFMSILEKIVFVADKIESGRNFEEIDYLKNLAVDDLDKALFAILQITTSLTIDKGNNVHPLSLEVLMGALIVKEE